ncbi:hypothetical protein [Virgibacillus halodenitrificans]|jgi:hypothetical protein|uniref:Uncharacterized protein n=1 Tax=Virgibacillus halodenitrificans TaxID=1482 RepID=A0AAC9IYN4_VIRHA|nr:hypothetical protein [Virgibacillus halodenitrificans]APC48032.1 hypothetical protein BME96_07535 [Virgibacillus halodenitrificans]MBD1223934.1 hypothetical protein [Virgibacillus halodenitrificans]MCG1027803.1 hypothetical protein [Virgibacillus halodenitrificans]MCJ0931743.1 hypothetical protein [Virgibacillus halodenitrificans]MEC2159858.1 hypothetical protein [Virgibacillus halodenitrificans]
MRHYVVLRLLLAAFLLYVAWPIIPQETGFVAKLFWGGWLAFFILVVGGNFAALLQMVTPPVMEQKELRRRQASNH